MAEGFSVNSTTESNVTDSNVTSVVKEDSAGWVSTCTIVLLFLVIIVTVIGNTMIIVAVATTRRLRTVTNCFVMSLAVADWMVGIFVIPGEVAYTIMHGWELGSVLCDVWISLDVLLCTASILSLCAISVDRYLSVTQPLTYSRKRRSKRLALIMILIVWLAALVITCPPILGWYDPEHSADRKCGYNQIKGYVVFSAMGSFFIPLAVMLYVYARISCVVAQRHNQLEVLDGPNQRSIYFLQRSVKLPSQLGEESDTDRQYAECLRCAQSPRCYTTLNNSIHQYPNRHSRASYTYCPMCKRPPETLSIDVSSMVDTSTLPMMSNRVSSFKRESKTNKTLTVVVGMFVACWFPFFTVYLIQPFLPTDKSVSNEVMKLLIWLGWINSAINPFIYAFYSPDFRLAFWRLTIRHCTKTKRPTESSLRGNK